MPLWPECDERCLGYCLPKKTFTLGEKQDSQVPTVLGQAWPSHRAQGQDLNSVLGWGGRAPGQL